MSFKPLDLDTASCILDFSGGDPALKSLGKLQLEGAVALHNMIADPEIGMGYLADEVGMGKTYQALGLAALLWHLKPTAEIAFIAPREAVQQHWRDLVQSPIV